MTLPAPFQVFRMPETYEAAKNALARLDLLDEVKEWSDRAAALKVYAKQADDQTLLNLAMRIKARAVRRAGELLKEIDGKGRNQHSEDSGGAPTTQREAAEAAGLSKDQQVQAVRVANIPETEFEARVESEKPPTITKLAELGIVRRPEPIVVRMLDIPSVKILTAADRHDQLVLQKLVEARHRLLGVTDDRLTMAIAFIDSAIKAIESGS